MRPRQPAAPCSYLIVPPVTRRSSLVPPSASTLSVAFVRRTNTHKHTHKPAISKRCTPLCTSWQPPQMFPSCRVLTLIEQRTQQSKRHMIRHLGYVKAARLKVFGGASLGLPQYLLSLCSTVKSGGYLSLFAHWSQVVAWKSTIKVWFVAAVQFYFTRHKNAWKPHENHDGDGSLRVQKKA